MTDSFAQRLGWVLWPSFLVACAAELAFFSLFDPRDLSLAVRSCDVVLVEARLAGGEVMLADRLAYAAAAAAYCAEIPVWGVIGTGRALPGQVLEFVIEQYDGAEPVPLGLLTTVVGPGGAMAPPSTLPAACAFAPELMRVSPI